MRTMLPTTLLTACVTTAAVAPSAEADADTITKIAAPPAPAAPDRTPTAPCAQLPVGDPPGRGYRVAQGFGTNRHLGEDWNGVGGGNSDLGDPVYAMADGVVSAAHDFRGGWGRVVRIEHRFTLENGVEAFESLYAHLDDIAVELDQRVVRGQRIGSIGDAHGAYVAHLHLEVRDVLRLPLGPGYASDRSGYIDPRTWVAAHRSGCPPG